MIAVVIPTIRPESYKRFIKAWQPLFNKHDVRVVKVIDGEIPMVEVDGQETSITSIMGKDKDLIYNFNDGVRNLGFFWCAQRDVDTIISLDDDVLPKGDPIQDHLDALNMRVPTTWVSTASEYMRGFPYGVRTESEVVLSHGVWDIVPDFDAPTQLTRKSTKKITYYKGVVPKGALFPLCAMNFAFKSCVLPYIYQAPMYGDINRFADIWGGIEAKKSIDRKGWAVVTGYSTINHTRASNVFVNLIKESRGLQMNENYGKDPYFEVFFKKRKRWETLCKSLL